MEIFFKIIAITFLAAIVLVPFFYYKYQVARNSYNFWIYTLFTLICSGILAIVLAWWHDYSSMLLLQHYGYDATAMSEAAQYKNVANHNLEKIKNLKVSLGGISWPLKFAIGFPLLVLYNLIVLGIMKFYYRYRDSR